MKMYIFEEWNNGEVAIFTSEKKRHDFLLEYVQKMTNEFGEPPVQREDYSLAEAELDPDFTEWWNT